MLPVLHLRRHLHIAYFHSFSTLPKKPNEIMRVLVTIAVGMMFGFFVGVSFPSLSLTKVQGFYPFTLNANKFVTCLNCSFRFFQLNITTALIHDFVIIEDKSTANSTQDTASTSSSSSNQVTTDVSKVCIFLLT